MDALKKAADVYRQLAGHEYIITFSNNESVRIIFKTSNFKHLACLHKFIDLDFISTEQRASILLKKVLTGEITATDLSCSCFFNQEERDRIESLSRIHEVLVIGGLAVYGFRRDICKARVRFKSDILFFKDDGRSFFITFGIAKDKEGTYYYPETIFYRFDRTYIENQNIVSIINIEVKSMYH